MLARKSVMRAGGERGLLTRPRNRILPGRAASAAAAPRRAPARVAASLLSGTTNPAFTGFGHLDEAVVESRYGSKAPLSLDGTINKTGLLLALSAASAAATWMQLLSGSPGAFAAVLTVSKMAGVVAMVAAFASMFRPLWSSFTAPVYAVAKGVALAGLSVYAEVQVPGAAFNTVLLTMCTAGSLLLGLRSGLIQVTDQFSSTVRAVSGGFFLFLLAGMLLSLVGVKLPSLLSAGPVGIGIALVSAGLAAANLLLDMDFVRQSARSRAVPAALEWYMAQNLLFELVWLYMSILQLVLMLGGGRGGDS